MKSTYLASFVTRSSHCVASLGATIPHPAIPPPERILVRPVCAQRSKYARAPPAHVPFTSTTIVQELPFGLAPSGSLNGCARRRLDSLRRRASARRSNTPHRTRNAQLSHAGKLHSNEAPFPRNQPAVSAHIVSAANVAQRMMQAAAASANAISPPSIKATPIQTNRFTFMSPPHGVTAVRSLRGRLRGGPPIDATRFDFSRSMRTMRIARRRIHALLDG